MRVLRPASVALFGAAVLTGVILTGSPAVSAPNGPSLTVAPDHGLPTAVFVVQYRVDPTGVQQGPRLGCPVVQFTWDSRPLGGPRRSARRDGTTCVASLRARPPAQDRTVGAHRIGVTGTFGRASQVTTYAIQAPASPTPTAGRATPTHTAAGAQDPTEPAIFTPIPPTGQVVPLNGGLASPVTAPLAKSGGSATPLIMVVGGVLVLGGAGALGMLIHRGRRRRPGPRLDPEFGFDPEVGGFYD